MSKLILASASTARLALLESIDLKPDAVMPADIDETALPKELPRDYVLRVAEGKADEIHKTEKGSFIIAADTIACVGTRVIGKAFNEEDAREIVTTLSGRRHRVYSGVCVIAPDGKKKVKKVLTVVKFKRLDKQEIDDYVKSHAWEGKSGCFSIQGKAGEFIVSINGSFSNVVGLPLYETKGMLKSLGY